MKSNPSVRIEAYTEKIAEALASGGHHVHLVEACLACLTMAMRTLAMMEAGPRDRICEVIEDNFREDVEELARMPNAQAGTFRMQ